jgi:rubrerythrin
MSKFSLSRVGRISSRKAQGETKEALERLAAWERGHAAFFRELHDTAFEAYAHMPWGG